MTTHSAATTSLPGAPTAKPVSGLTAWWVQRIGRRDTTGPAPEPTTGHLPYTRRLHGRAPAAEAAVSQVLHQQITQIDQAFIAVCAQIAHHHHSATAAQTTAAAIPSGAEPGSLLASAQSRELRRLHSEATNHQQSIADLTGRVAGLLAQRRHLLNEGRDRVDGHAARYQELVACHRRGYDRPTRRGTAATGTPHPAYIPTATWVTGDLPILTAAVDPATHEVIRWALREFDESEHHTPRLYAV